MHLHFHCVVIDGVFDATAARGVVLQANAGLDGQRVLRRYSRDSSAPRVVSALVRWGCFPASPVFRLETCVDAGRGSEEFARTPARDISG